MWSEVVGNTFRAWFHVSNAQGVLRTGLINSDFTVSVRSPDDTAITSPSVSESTTPGLYYFDIAGTFLTTNGIGEYGVVVTISATGPVLRGAKSEVLKVSDQDISTIAGAVWDELLASHTIAGSFGEAIGNLQQVAYVASLTVQVGSTQSSVVTDLAGVQNGAYNGMRMLLNSASGQEYRIIRDQTGSTLYPITPFSLTPTNGDGLLVLVGTSDLLGKVR
jgi:hypothetical protein